MTPGRIPKKGVICLPEGDYTHFPLYFLNPEICESIFKKELKVWQHRAISSWKNSLPHHIKARGSFLLQDRTIIILILRH